MFFHQRKRNRSWWNLLVIFFHLKNWRTPRKGKKTYIFFDERKSIHFEMYVLLFSHHTKCMVFFASHQMYDFFSSITQKQIFPQNGKWEKRHTLGEVRKKHTFDVCFFFFFFSCRKCNVCFFLSSVDVVPGKSLARMYVSGEVEVWERDTEKWLRAWMNWWSSSFPLKYLTCCPKRSNTVADLRNIEFGE